MLLNPVGFHTDMPGPGCAPGALGQDVGAQGVVGSVWMLGPRIQSLWLLTLTRVRQSFCVTTINCFSSLLEKQEDKTQTKTGTRWFCSNPTATDGMVTKLRPKYVADFMVLFFPLHNITSEEGDQQCLDRGWEVKGQV